MNKKFKSLAELEKYFGHDWECKRYIESLRWKNGLVSPYTGSNNTKQIGFYDYYVCQDTGKGFSALTATIFANTKVDLSLWFQVIWLNWLHPELGSAAISRQVGLNQKTVWSMLKKIRTALENTSPFVK